MSKDAISKIIPIGICCFLLSPCLALLAFTSSWVMPQWGELFWALGNSFVQSFFSALVTLIFGFIVALGSIKIPSNRIVGKSIFEILCLITQFIPVVVSLVAILNLIQPFPMGTIGVVMIHGFINFGLAAILISQIIKGSWSETADVARTMGVTRINYWIRIGIPQIKRELVLVYLYLFSLFFTSFSVPLVVGGGKGTTLEILIYEKMRLSLDWSAAVILAWVQIIFIFALSLLALKQKKEAPRRDTDLSWLGSYLGVFILIFLMTGLFVGYSSGLAEGWIQRQELSTYGSDFIIGFLNSVALGLITYVFVTGFLKAIALLGVVPDWLDKFMNGYLAPSTALTCFAFLVVMPAEQNWSYIKIPLAFTLLSLPAIYRMGFGEKLKDLQSQLEHANLLGAPPYLTFKSVTWPQIKKQSRFLAALVATWACGDFAVSRILSTKDFTLGLIVQTLLSTYRMSLASLVSVILLVACLVCFFLIMGLDYVDRRKS